MRTLVTGATGAIGIPLIDELLAHGHRVTVLVRSKTNRSLQDVTKLYRGKVGILEGDVSEVNCGVPTAVLRRNIGSFDAIIHAAGKVQYHEHKREETYRANVGGAENTIALATDLEIERFVFISTAYVAGKKLYFGEGDIGSVADAHNPYESSKIEAERLVRNFPGEHLILRLSTVIGHSQTGFIVNVGGYAGFVKVFWVMRKRIARYPDNPFWVGLNPASTLNLVTSNWVVEHSRKATESNLTGTFHLSHPTPVGMGWLFRETFRNKKALDLPLTYEHTVVDHSALFGRDPVWESTQEGIAEIVEYFRPYVTRDTVFGHERVKLIPGYEPPQLIDENVIAAQMDYMLNQLFTKKKLAAVAVA